MSEDGNKTQALPSNKQFTSLIIKGFLFL